MAEGSVVNLSTLSLSPHVGTHADAPLHYDAQGAAAGALNLAPYLGPCRVVHAIGCGPQVQWQHLAHAITPDLPPRLLVRTYRQAPQGWDPQLSGIAPEVLARLADLGLRLIGIDTASIDPADSHALQLIHPELAVEGRVVRHQGRAAHKDGGLAHDVVGRRRGAQHGAADAGELGDVPRHALPGIHQALETVDDAPAFHQHDADLGRARAVGGAHARGFKVQDGNALLHGF